MLCEILARIPADPEVLPRTQVNTQSYPPSCTMLKKCVHFSCTKWPSMIKAKF